jgi:hypothetical protein
MCVIANTTWRRVKTIESTNSELSIVMNYGGYTPGVRGPVMRFFIIFSLWFKIAGFDERMG